MDGKSVHEGGGCEFDQFTSNGDGYGESYITTNCSRLGGYIEKDMYDPINDYDKVAETINLFDLITSKIKLEDLGFPFKKYSIHMIGILKATIKKLKKDLEYHENKLIEEYGE